MTTASTITAACLVDCNDRDCAGQPTCEEHCDNCIDDGDGAIDRDDGDCAPRADGAGAGTADPAERGKPIAKCAVTMQKAGAKVVGTRRKALQTCLARLGRVRPEGDPAMPACLAKAGAALPDERREARHHR